MSVRREADCSYVGAGKAAGKNINIPLNKTGCDYADYNAIFQRVVLPVAQEFAPQLIVVSCGFDAGADDPEGQMKLTPSCFANLTAQLLSVGSVKNRVVMVLEGGYNVPLVAESSMACLRVLLGDEPPPLPTTYGKPDDVVLSTIERVTSVLRPYWKCFANIDHHSGDGDNGDKKSVQFTYKNYNNRHVECPVHERLPENWTTEHQQNIKNIDAELRRKNY